MTWRDVLVGTAGAGIYYVERLSRLVRKRRTCAEANEQSPSVKFVPVTLTPRGANQPVADDTVWLAFVPNRDGLLNSTAANTLRGS